ncbi:helix-turn-helix transcriptional regulator [Mesorhizobium sp. B3-1-7]|uniref:helix-turn-helix domain-containing protein n=1 Tax=Mesorhizobium sp. B3-1-7 TaxID=2589894 RepID=UPI00112E06B0|nr:helix-turn-helix transcriptional regulator [Mesorhizobium sp. B3-1-7]TPI65058.1 helix-turn-helix transcriptional regulator [Mesorhizobium sp. B3-1-7]
MNMRKIIGWNLRKHRVERGMSQERLALAAEIDRAYVGRVERGSENVTTDTLAALANALGVAPAVLLTEPPEGAQEPPSLKSGRKPKAG